jgi:5-methylcytosine-specific restriction endonuclease McrA
MIPEIHHREEDKTGHGAVRSGEWHRVRAEHLTKEPRCAVCDGDRKLEVHHILPFHLHPEHELNPHNLITLCEEKEDGINCHLAFGHLGSFKSFNIHVRSDAFQWKKKIENRP